MSKLEYGEIKPRKIIIYKDEPYEVIESFVARTDQRKPQNQTKLRNLINGRVIPATFHASDSVYEADITRKEAKYLYSNKLENWFCNINNASERFTVENSLLNETKKFLKENSVVDIKIWTDDEDKEKIIGITLPVKITLEVKDAPPAIKGNTASGGNKVVTLETGLEVTVPLFIKTGEKIIINTETGEYVERAK